MKIAFVLNDLQLSGGVGIVVEHGRRLSQEHGFDVTLALARPQELPSWRYENLTGLRVADARQLAGERFDVVVATWWETTHAAFGLQADRYAAFVQSLEDRFYRPDEPERVAAAVETELPVSFITEATWIADTLAQIRPEAPCHLVRNGIDKEVFAGPRDVHPRVDGPLRILVEGRPSTWFKGVPEAVSAVAAMAEPHHLTVVTDEHALASGPAVDRVVGPLTHREMADLYSESDVVLKLSRVEGMYGPPLEGFHMGATCVTTEVTGHDEYVVHGWNGLVVDWDDVRGTARQLDLLARDRRLLHFLRTNALHTARGWPSTHKSAQFMALALRRIHREPAPPTAPAVRTMLAQVRAGMEVHRGHVAQRNAYARQAERVERVKAMPPVAQVRSAWRSPPVQRTVGPAVLRLARRLLGR